jgi:AMP deaminase
LESSHFAYNKPNSEDEEPYPKDQDLDELSSEDSLNGRQDEESLIRPAKTLMPDSETPDEITPEGAEDGMLARDIQRKTAYYDYAAEKQMSQADAKLFYQQSQLEAQKTGGSNRASQYSPQGSPIMTAARSFSNLSNSGNMEQNYLQRSESIRSMQSAQASSK